MNRDHQHLINYLLGLDAESKADADECFASAWDYGKACSEILSDVDNPKEEIYAALIYGALKNPEETVRLECAHALTKLDSRLGNIIMYLLSLDEDGNNRDSSIEYLGMINKNTSEMSKRAVDRLLNDQDDMVQKTAKAIKSKEPKEERILYNGLTSGQYYIEGDGSKKYVK